MAKATFITAINKVHQGKVNKACNWLVKYNEFNRQRDLLESDDDDKAIRSINRLCENSFDKYLTIVDELPKREKVNIEKSELY